MGFSIEYFIKDLIVYIEDKEDPTLRELLTWIKDQEQYAKDCGVIK